VWLAMRLRTLSLFLSRREPMVAGGVQEGQGGSGMCIGCAFMVRRVLTRIRVRKVARCPWW
jgi:hypothetical protein